MPVADAGERLGPIFLYFLPTAAPIAQLAAVKFGIDEFQINAQPGGQAGNPGDQRLPVRLSGSGELQHSALSVCGKKLPRHVCALSVARGGRKLGILTERAKSVKGMPHITEPLLDAFEHATLRLRHSNVRTEAQWRLNRSGWRRKRLPPSPF